MLKPIDTTNEAEGIFHIGDILSVLTKKMLSHENEKGVLRLLSYMTDDNIHTFQLPRVIEECIPELKRQFPDWTQVVDFLTENVTPKNCLELTQQVVNEWGAFHKVQKIDPELHVRRNPKEEAMEIAQKLGFLDEALLLKEKLREANKKPAKKKEKNN